MSGSVLLCWSSAALLPLLCKEGPGEVEISVGRVAPGKEMGTCLCLALPHLPPLTKGRIRVNADRRLRSATAIG